MTSTRRLLPWLGSAQAWIGLSVLAPLGMLVVSGFMLLDLRRDAWEKAEETSKNLLQVIERDIARNAEIFDLSLRAVVDNLMAPGVAEVSPELRQLILFDRAATAKDMGVMLVIDEKGDVVIDAAGVVPRKANYADRDYFQAHKLRDDLGLHVGPPLVSRLTGERMLLFSRRISKPDGSFGGVVLGTLRLTYFSRLFDQLGLGPEGAITLFHRDGTRIMRYPYVEADLGVNVAGTPNFDRFVREGSGSFVGISVRDGVERHFAFMRIGDLPLVLTVAKATDDIEAAWRAKAVVISAIVLVLCGLTVSLSLLFGRELRRRTAIQAELAHLSCTDSLTGLPNRRQFDETITRASASARRSRTPLSLLVVDADHFKRFNDRYGHVVGDEVLKGLARCLSASVHRPDDLVCRVGGEEFVLLLPHTDRDGAHRIAEKVHAEISTLAIASAGIKAGSVTVSIGLATVEADRPELIAPTDLYTLADAALYEAKAKGRNQTRCAEPYGAQAARRPTMLHVVDAT